MSTATAPTAPCAPTSTNSTNWRENVSWHQLELEGPTSSRLNQERVSVFASAPLVEFKLLTCRLLMAPLRELHGLRLERRLRDALAPRAALAADASWPNLCTTPPQGDRQRSGAGERQELHDDTAKVRRCLSPMLTSKHLCLRLLAGSHGVSTTSPYDSQRSWRPFLRYRHSMVLCRLWGEELAQSLLQLFQRAYSCCRAGYRRYPRSSSSASRREPRFASRSWRNSLSFS